MEIEKGTIKKIGGGGDIFLGRRNGNVPIILKTVSWNGWRKTRRRRLAWQESRGGLRAVGVEPAQVGPSFKTQTLVQFAQTRGNPSQVLAEKFLWGEAAEAVPAEPGAGPWHVLSPSASAGPGRCEGCRWWIWKRWEKVSCDNGEGRLGPALHGVTEPQQGWEVSARWELGAGWSWAEMRQKG